MPSKFLLQELNKIKKLIPKLEPYWRREVRELPDELKKELYQIKAIPPLTSGGLENVNSVLETLFLAQLNIEDLDKETKTVPSLKQPIAPKEPETLTPTIPPVNLSAVPKTNLPAPSAKPQQVLVISQKPTTLTQTKSMTDKEIIIKESPDLPSSPPTPPSPKSPDTLDFGPYYPKNIKNNH